MSKIGALGFYAWNAYTGAHLLSLSVLFLHSILHQISRDEPQGHGDHGSVALHAQHPILHPAGSCSQREPR